MIGRQQERAELRRLLGGRARLVVVTGPGGIGKTVLARSAAAEAGPAYADGVVEVTVDDVAGPELVGEAVARTLGAQPDGGSSGDPQLVAAVGDRQLLLLLDGCDRVVDRCAELAATLVAHCPHLVVLATCRQPLGVTGETVLRVGPLEHPDPAQGALPPWQELAHHDAVRLLLAKAAPVVPSFAVTEENATAVAELCATLGGVPLALELAAARLTVLSPEDLVARMRERHRVLTKGNAGAPAHLSSLRASVDLSYELCTPEEQRVWARLSVFAGSFDLDAVEGVCSGDGVRREEVLDVVDGLLERSVLAREDDDPTKVRYRMPETVRTYGEEHLSPAEQTVWRDRHLAWYSALVEEAAASWFGPEQRRWVRRLRWERPNLDAALAYAVGSGQARSALTLAVGLRSSWIGTGRLGEARHWLRRALALPGAPAPLHLEGLLVSAWFAVFGRDGAAAEADLRAAEELAARSGIPTPPGWLLACGAATMVRGVPEEALPLIDRGVAAARTEGDRATLASGLLLAGFCRSLVGDLDGGAAALRECIAVTERAGETVLRSYALGLVAVQGLHQRDLGIADEAGRQALRVKAELGDRFAQAAILDVLACVAAAEDDGERAATLFGAAEALWRKLGRGPESFPPLAEPHRDGVGRARSLLGARRYQARCRLGAEMGTAQAVGYALEDVIAEPQPEGPAVPLTARELEVAVLVGDGLTNREIAERLVISPRTAQGHVENILRKLGFSSRTQVAAWVAAGHLTRSRDG